MRTESIALLLSVLVLVHPAVLGRSLQKRSPKRQLVLGALAVEELASLLAGSLAVGTGSVLASQALQHSGQLLNNLQGVNTGDKDSHSCHNNRGWCRYMCQGHEKTTPHYGVCTGGYDCCIPNNR